MVIFKACVILSHHYWLCLMKVIILIYKNFFLLRFNFIDFVFSEVITYSCFCHLMKRLLPNFPHGAGMDENLGHMRSLLQILDSELYEHIHRTGDFTHFYFCYRWFLLDFKRGKNFL